MFRTDVPLDLIAAMVGNQLLDDTEWTVDTYSVSGSNGSERTYSVPGRNPMSCSRTRMLSRRQRS